MNGKTESLPTGLEEFILTHFETLTQVEVLCYLFTHKSEDLTDKIICHRLFLSETLTKQSLDKLSSIGLISQDGSFYKVSERNPVEAFQCMVLCQLFETRKPLIVEILFNSSKKEKL